MFKYNLLSKFVLLEFEWQVYHLLVPHPFCCGSLCSKLLSRCNPIATSICPDIDIGWELNAVYINFRQLLPFSPRFTVCVDVKIVLSSFDMQFHINSISICNYSCQVLSLRHIRILRITLFKVGLILTVDK